MFVSQQKMKHAAYIYDGGYDMVGRMVKYRVDTAIHFQQPSNTTHVLFSVSIREWY